MSSATARLYASRRADIPSTPLSPPRPPSAGLEYSGDPAPYTYESGSSKTTGLMGYLMYAAMGAVGLSALLFFWRPKFVLDKDDEPSLTILAIAAVIGAVLGFVLKKFVFA